MTLHMALTALTIWLQSALADAATGIEWREVAWRVVEVLLFFAGLLGFWLRTRVEARAERKAIERKAKKDREDLKSEMQSQYVNMVDDLRSTQQTQAGEIVMLRDDLNAARALATEEKERRMELEQTIFQRRNEADNLIQINNRLRKDNERQKDEFAREIQSLQDIHSKQVAKLQDQIDQQAAQIEDLNKLRDDLRRDREVSIRKIKTLEELVETLRDRNQKLLTKLRDETARANMLERQRDTLHEQLVRLEAKLQSTQDELERLREIVEKREGNHEHDEAVRMDDATGGDPAGAGNAGNGAGGTGDRADEHGGRDDGAGGADLAE